MFTTETSDGKHGIFFDSILFNFHITILYFIFHSIYFIF